MHFAAVHTHAHAVAAYGVVPTAITPVDRPGEAEGGRVRGDHAGQPAATGPGPAVVNHVAPVAGVQPQPSAQRETQQADAEVGAGAEGTGLEGGEAVDAQVEGVDQDGEQRSARGGDEGQTPEEEAAEAEELRKLEARDAEVRTHEQAHAAAGGPYAGSPQYQFERGPDGRSYAVEGEVSIDVSAVSGNPQATIQKMQQVKRAALAPASPSGADRSVAASADAKLAAARRELAALQAEPAQDAGAAEVSSEADAQVVGVPAADAALTGGVGIAGGDGAAGKRGGASTAAAFGLSGAAAFDAARNRAAGLAAYAPPAPAAGATISVLSCSNCGGAH